LGLYLKKKESHHNKRAGRVAQSIGPEFKPQYHKKKKKELDKSNVCVYVFKRERETEAQKETQSEAY
jgi:hypothetical protein